MAEFVYAAIYAIGEYFGVALSASAVASIATALAIVTSYAYSSYQQRRARKKATDQYNANLEDRLVMAAISDGTRSRIYGRVRNVDGVLFKQTHGANKEFYRLVVALAGHECDAIEDVYFADAKVVLGEPDADGWQAVLSQPYMTVENIPGTINAIGTGAPQSVSLPAALVPDSVWVAWSDGSGEGSLGASVPADVVGSTATFTAPAGVYVTVGYSGGRGTPHAKVRKWLGAPGQDLSPGLFAAVGNEVSGSDRFAGICLIEAELDYNTDAYPSGVPSITGVVRGARVLDPRTGVFAWTENPALIARDWAYYGAGGACLADTVADGDVRTAANGCDITHLFTESDGTQTLLPLYRCGIAIKTDQDPSGAMDEIVESMAGKWGWGGGVLKMRAGVFAAPVATLTEDWISGAEAIGIVPEPAADQAVNIMRATIADAAQGYVAVQAPEVRAEPYIANDGRELPRETTYAAVTDHLHAQHISGVTMRDERSGLATTLPCNLRALPLEVFDVINVQLPHFGWTPKVVEVMGWQFSAAGGVVLTCKETAASIFDPDAQFTAADATPNSNLPNPFIVADIEHLRADSSTAQLLRQADGTIVSRVWVRWDEVHDQAVLDNPEGVVIAYGEVRGDGEPRFDYQESVPGNARGAFLQSGVRDLSNLMIRARARNRLVKGKWCPAILHTVLGKTERPGDVLDLVCAVNSAGVQVTWLPCPDADYSETELRRGASWAAGAPLFGATPTRISGSLLQWPRPAAGAYQVWAKHIDTTGNESADAFPTAVAVPEFVDAEDGADALSFVLSNDAHTLAADGYGHVASFAGAETTIAVYRGGVDETALWAFSRRDHNLHSTFVAHNWVVVDATGSTRLLVHAGALAGPQDSATGRHPILNGGGVAVVPSGESAFGMALGFDGSAGSYLEVGHDNDFGLFDQDFAVQCRVAPVALRSERQFLIGSWGPTPAARAWALLIGADGSLEFDCGLGDGTERTLRSTRKLGTGRITEVAVGRQGAELTLKVGDKVETFPFDATIRTLVVVGQAERIAGNTGLLGEAGDFLVSEDGAYLVTEASEAAVPPSEVPPLRIGRGLAAAQPLVGTLDEIRLTVGASRTLSLPQLEPWPNPGEPDTDESDSGWVDIIASRDGYKSVRKRFSVAKARSGAVGVSGVAGATSRLLTLTASSQVFSVNTDGIGSPYQITFTATGQNLNGAPDWYVVSGSARLVRNGATCTLLFSDMQTDQVAVRVAQDGQSDEVTIVKVRDGSGAVNVLLTNETHTVPADRDGKVDSWAGVSTRVIVYVGAKEVTGQWQTSRQDHGLYTDVKAATPYTVDVIGMPGDAGYCDIFVANPDYGEISKRFTVAKSRAGQGATLLALTASSQVFSVSANGVGTPGSITFSVGGQNLTGLPLFSVIAGNAVLHPDGIYCTLNFAEMEGDLVTVQATQNGQVDRISVVKVREGSPSVTAFLTNEAHNLAADAAGNVTNFAGASTSIAVFRGAVDDTLNWSMNRRDQGVYSDVKPTTPYTVDIVGMPNDTGYVDLTVSRAGYPQITKRFSLAKSRAGAAPLSLAASSQVFAVSAAGAGSPASIVFTVTGQATGQPVFSVIAGRATLQTDGTNCILPFASMETDLVTVQVTQGGQTDHVTVVKVRDGSGGVSVFLTNESQTVPSNADGEVTSWAGASTSAVVYVGAVIDTPNWTLNRRDSGIFTRYPNQAADPYTLEAFGMTADTGYSDITLSRAGYAQVSRRFTVTKAKAGQQGKKGDAGDKGDDGDPGPRGATQVVRQFGGNTWDDLTAVQAIASAGYGAVRSRDMVTLFNPGAGYSETRFYDLTGGPGNTPVWVAVTEYLDGNLFVKGSIAGDRLIVGTVAADHLNAADGSFTGELRGAKGTFDGELLAGVINLEKLAGTSQTFSNPGSFTVTVPAGMTTMRAVLVGGGGGGSGYSEDDNDNWRWPGSGGGGGGVSAATWNGLTAGTAFQVIVGSGGTGGQHLYEGAHPKSWADGTAGGASSVNGLSAGGGGGGRVLYDYNGGGGGGGYGGVGSSANGDDGTRSYSATDHYAGRGGNAAGQGNGGNPSPGDNYPGFNGGRSGGGGGGGGKYSVGGAGHPGKAQIEFFNPNSVVVRSEFTNLLNALAAQNIKTS